MSLYADHHKLPWCLCGGRHRVWSNEPRTLRMPSYWLTKMVTRYNAFEDCNTSITLCLLKVRLPHPVFFFREAKGDYHLHDITLVQVGHRISHPIQLVTIMNVNHILTSFTPKQIFVGTICSANVVTENYYLKTPHIQSSGAPEIQCKYKNITVSQLNTYYRIVSYGNDSAKRWVLSLLRKRVEVGEVRICRGRRFQADGAATEKELFESWRLDRGTIKSPRDVDQVDYPHLGSVSPNLTAELT